MLRGPSGPEIRQIHLSGCMGARFRLSVRNMCQMDEMTADSAEISPARPDHGGGIDAAATRFGGERSDWIDLSTGINPQPYPLPDWPADAWTALPDQRATDALEAAARAFWSVPTDAAVLAAPGASALIARLPYVVPPGSVDIPGPTYNEHARAFRAAGWNAGAGAAKVIVHPNNPDGRVWTMADANAPFCIIDESFCDVIPSASLITRATQPGTIILKSFGKFWGLAGVRLGFAIGDAALIARLTDMMGPWPVSGPALFVGALALRDHAWAGSTRQRLQADAARLDGLMKARGATIIGGTTLFRLYDLPDAIAAQTAMARHHIWTRAFPYNPRWLRLGLPGTPAAWNRLAKALDDVPE